VGGREKEETMQKIEIEKEIGEWVKERKVLPPTPKCDCPGKKIYIPATQTWWCPKCQNGKRKVRER